MNRRMRRFLRFCLLIAAANWSVGILAIAGAIWTGHLPSHGWSFGGVLVDTVESSIAIVLGFVGFSRCRAGWRTATTACEIVTRWSETRRS